MTRTQHPPPTHTVPTQPAGPSDLAMTCGRGEDGYVSLYVVAITLALIALAGLVLDGGTAITAREQAADTAQQAARAGADALTPQSLRGTGPLRAATAAATTAAGRVLTARGMSGTVTITGDQVTVTAHVQKRTAILSAVGLTTITGTAQATATALRGTTTSVGG